MRFELLNVAMFFVNTNMLTLDDIGILFFAISISD